MSKNILILYGSPKSNGYIYKLVSQFINFLGKDYAVTIYDTYKNKIKPCMGCDKCKHGLCIYDDMTKLHKLICESDAIIVASPIHNLTFSSPLITIFERFQVYFNNRQKAKTEIFSKKRPVILLASSGRNSKKAIEIMKEQMSYILRLINAELINVVCWENTDIGEAKPKMIDSVELLIDALTHGIKTNLGDKKCLDIQNGTI